MRRSVRVRLDGRRFVVTFDEDGSAIRIGEYKNGMSRGRRHFWNFTYWSLTHHGARTMGFNTIPNRIIREARLALQS